MSNIAEQEVLSNDELTTVVKGILDNRKKKGKKLTKAQQELLVRAQKGDPLYIFLFLVKMGYTLRKWDGLWFPKNKQCVLFDEPYRIKFRYDQLKIIRGYFKNPHSISTSNPSKMTPWD